MESLDKEKPAIQYYWEDLPVGTVLELGSVTVDREESLAFGRRYDPQPFHVDGRSRFGVWLHGGAPVSGVAPHPTLAQGRAASLPPMVHELIPYLIARHLSPRYSSPKICQTKIVTLTPLRRQ